MDFNVVLQAIGSVGFPIVACMYMAWLHNDSEIRHSDERKSMTEAINNNTRVLEIIKDRMDIKD